MNNKKPSQERKWEKYFTQERLHYEKSQKSIYQDILKNENFDYNKTAIEYFGVKISYKQLFDNTSKVENVLRNNDIKSGDVVSLVLPTLPETIYTVYAIVYC